MKVIITRPNKIQNTKRCMWLLIMDTFIGTVHEPIKVYPNKDVKICIDGRNYIFIPDWYREL